MIRSSRRKVLAQLLGTVALGAAPRVAFAATPRPDIVLFVADDLSCTDIGPEESRDARTPNIDRLAKNGVVFTRAYAASPTCTPARSAMLTGYYPMRNGAHANHSSIHGDLRTMPSYLATLGYRVVVAGKTDFGPRAQFPFEYLAGSSVRSGEARGALGWRLDTPAIRRLFATRDPKTPLAVFIASYQPHVPWAPNRGFDPAALTLPKTFIDTPETRDAQARYLTDVEDFDRELGDVRAAISNGRHASNTCFILAGDHGAQVPFAKWNLYDPGLHVPLIVSWPGVTSVGQRTAAMVSMIDLMPTVIEAAGGAAPATIDGRSFLPVLRGRATTFRDAIFASHTGDKNFNRSPMRCVRTDRWKLIHNLDPKQPFITAMTEAEGKEGALWSSWLAAARSDASAAAVVQRLRHRPPIELYDLQTDPDELHNLADDARFSAVQAELRRRLDQWRLQQGETLAAVPMPEDASYDNVRYGPWTQ